MRESVGKYAVKNKYKKCEITRMAKTEKLIVFFDDLCYNGCSKILEE